MQPIDEESVLQTVASFLKIFNVQIVHMLEVWLGCFKGLNKNNVFDGSGSKLAFSPYMHGS